MIKFNPFTGKFDFVGSGGGSSSPENFSYQFVGPSQTITVPSGQQMLFEIPLDIEGTLVVDGFIVEVA